MSHPESQGSTGLPRRRLFSDATQHLISLQPRNHQYLPPAAASGGLSFSVLPWDVCQFDIRAYVRRGGEWCGWVKPDLSLSNRSERC
jgi:hypothetical protein